MDIKALKDGLDVGDYGDQLTQYSGYICDAISELADANTSIYYSDIMDFMRGNIDAVNDAISGFGWDGCGGDLMKAGQAGEYLYIKDDIYDHYDDAIMYCMLDYLQSIGVVELTDEQIDALEGIDNDHNNTFDDLYDAVNEIIEQ